jgi:GTPase SAR1 family protein
LAVVNITGTGILHMNSASSILEQLSSQAREYYSNSVDPLAASLMFNREPDPGTRRGRPLVLLIGNHSSGKSTLINYMLGREVQNTGVAPTDDNFTVLSHGESDEERDGDALVSNPDLGFAELRKFGPSLVSHLKLKVRDTPFLKDLTLIDSPGMIDSAQFTQDRGYDFIKVVRWFAEQSDVILLLFDPDKPGTTGETLATLKDALGDMSHKLVIMLNKMDQFQSLHDFARAYGALCWNLAKVIPTKDVPYIHNIYIPGVWVQGEQLLPMDDFDQARDKVIQEIKRAPKRRIENILTRLYEHSRQLLAHSMICNEARKTYRHSRRNWRLWISGAFIAGAAGAAAAYHFLPEDGIMFGGGILAAGIVIAALLYLLGKRSLAQRENEIMGSLAGIYAKVFNRDYVLGDQADLDALWDRIQDRTIAAISTLGMGNLPRVKPAQIKALEQIIGTRVPELRSELHKGIKDEDKGSGSADAGRAF